MLQTAFNGFKVWAAILEKEDGIVYSSAGRDVIEQMANGYCIAKDLEDEHNKNKYIAGLMLRFWYVINKLKEKSPVTGLDYSDFMAWLYESIEYACKYRVWQKPDSKVNAQQAINQCIETIRMQKYYDLNLQKHKANVNTISLESTFEDDNRTTLLDTLVDEDALERERFKEGTGVAYDLIQTCINKKKLVEAIILDTIAFNDVQKVTKTVVKTVDDEGNSYKHTRQTSEFWPYKCVQILSNLPEDYATYFCEHYNVITEELFAALGAIRKANNQKLYKFLDKTIESTRELVVSLV
jgi:hypothetical protein